ncbi:65-kDa microtubule-associated protein 1 isoform X1 [Physcomitrium patens]|uniref:Uncharacterized protein n=1 Tax=Physcomitrium patens TaxID=3218 RepID=A0A2K1L2T7_PHYPA|nr:65-kDa microtubule-associated protein 1-like isoform X2 [Physcomitrium patens]XP_024402191.1 65-kDa microtubule-associated protein 1-like isoform X2 [Physcomitrium patens]XP_024402200.1 65-kDa microtubule-associated protein 1-like isoform X2 [Physcomitrium patens]XP_024402211.1 65-kDa microtubule-associated protein 1-like isoform X2 [Physcomitrium patens]XP_024402221.1 65-kDa microtubule-associated protein 1-like isoform X2 [Physcomitrium patens]XP_024402231.1 65-kDa microtubule-associated |eukprot:XP_024402181.1 65-kDa microtubule-associated protein 1-like isoform X2 [Physcomitrella patens]
MVQQPVTEVIADSTCSSLLRELQRIWDEVGENDVDRDKMLLQLEQECLEVYKRKVDSANNARARLHQVLASAEAELCALYSALGEPTQNQLEKRTGTLKDQISAVRPQLDELRRRKEARAAQFLEVKTEIAKICEEIVGNYGDVCVSEEDLTLRRLDEYHGQLAALQKEKSERVQKVLEYVNLMHQLCSVMNMDFFHVVTEVHPSLSDSQNLSKSISNETLDCLAKSIHSLKAEKRKRALKIKDLGTSMVELWRLMDTPVEEQQAFQHVTCHISASEDEIIGPSSLSVETIEEAQIEVERLDVLKKSKTKELVLKKRLELEEVCKSGHLEPDANTTADKLIAVINSGMVDLSDLLANLDEEIVRAKEEVASRKDIMILLEKWMSACEEEGWLEDYSKDENRFASKGAHLNLKRAEKARAAISKLPVMVESLLQRTKSWENERGLPFMFDGVRLLSMLNEYKNLREEKEEEKRRLRDHKKVQEQLLTEKETLFGSKPSPAKSTKKPDRGPRMSNIGANGHTPASRRLSLGSALMQPATPDWSRNGPAISWMASSGNGKADLKRDRVRPAAPPNFVAIDKEKPSFGGGSAPLSPRIHH